MSEAPIPDPQAEARAQLRSLAEQGIIPPSELDQRLAALAAGGAVAAVVPPGYAVHDRLQIVAGWSSERRTGRWTIPPFLRVQAAASNVRLDCREATAAAPLIDLEIGGGIAKVSLIVPDGWAVSADRLAKQLGTVSVRVPDRPAPGCPLIWVHGSVGIGTFRARVRSPRGRRD